MAKETVSKTFLVAGLLSVVCSALVSSAAVVFRPMQSRNKDLDRKRNVLLAAGLYEEGKPVEALFEKFEAKVVELESGAIRSDMDPADFDQRKAARNPEFRVEIPPKDDLAGIKRRSRFALVYLAANDQGDLEQLILPVHGRGLWSTMYGYLALDSDLRTINGFAFYEHGETPGLGGEIDNPRWRAQWIGKKAFDENGSPRITVLKGNVDPDSPGPQYQVDGLAGATITARGVDSLLKYWLGENGFEPFLDRLRARQ